MWFEELNQCYMDEAGDGTGGGGAGDAGSGDAGTGADGGQGSGDTAGDSGADAAAVAAAAAELNKGEGDTGWSFSDGIKGEGEKPEWFKDGKYKNVSEQAKAYTELESKLGSFTGAPEAYEVALSEELTEKGLTIDAEDPMVIQAKEFAKNAGMNQEGFQGLINLYGEVQLAQALAEQEVKNDELKALGPTAEKRIENLNLWGKANLSAELFAGFEGMIQTSEGVAAVERLVSMTRAAPMDAGDLTPATNGSAEELKELQFAKDEHGNRLINTDPNHRAKYQAMLEAVHGSGDHHVIVGSQ